MSLENPHVTIPQRLFHLGAGSLRLRDLPPNERSGVVALTSLGII